MQVLKPEKREKIIEVAERLFFEHGFEATTTRAIAAEANINVSNLYKYFKDKHAIFAAVIDPFHRFVRDDLAALFGDEHDESGDAGPGEAFTALMNVLKRDRTRFVILISRSGGTEYEYARGEIVDAIARHMTESVKGVDEWVVRLIATNLLNGIVGLTERYHDNPAALEVTIDTLMRYHMAGMRQFMGRTQ